MRFSPLPAGLLGSSKRLALQGGLLLASAGAAGSAVIAVVSPYGLFVRLRGFGSGRKPPIFFFLPLASEIHQQLLTSNRRHKKHAWRPCAVLRSEVAFGTVKLLSGYFLCV